MASSIISRTIAAVVDQRVTMMNSTWARPIPFGTSWSKLRVAVRAQLGDAGSDLTLATLGMGVCSGTSNILGDETTTHFVGLRTTGMWAREASSPPAVHYFPNPGTTLVPTKRVGSTFTDGTNFTASAVRINARAASAVAARTVLFLDITKGSPNFTLEIFGYVGSAAEQDVSRDSFLIQAGRAIPSITNYALSGGKTLAVDEGANGSLTHINIHWDQTVPQLELSDIAVARLA